MNTTYSNNGFERNTVQSCLLPASLIRQKGGRRFLRSQRGGQIVQLPPALFILLIAVFFPMIDLLYYGFAYCAAWYLHQLELRAVTVSQPPQAPPSTFDGHIIPELSQKETDFINTGLGQFLQLSDLKCQVQQIVDPNSPPNISLVGSSTLTNIFRVKALVTIPIPYFNNIPVLGGNGYIDFNYTTNAVQEEEGAN